MEFNNKKNNKIKSSKINPPIKPGEFILANINEQ